MSPSFFVLWRKERERMAMVAALLIFRSSFVEELQFSRWVHQEALIFETRSGCHDGHGTFYLLLDLHIWPLTRSGCAGVRTWRPFLCSDHGAGSISVLDDGFDPWNWLSALLFDTAAFPVTSPLLSSSSESRSWHRYSHRFAGFSLQFTAWSPCWCLPESS